MRIAQEKVESFHAKQGVTINDIPTLVNSATTKQRYEYILEELNEYVKADYEADLVAVADALGDLLYVVLGTAVVHGINIEPIFDEIHRSNMTKSALNAKGKGGKGPDYEPPRLGELLFQQRHPELMHLRNTKGSIN